MNHLKFNSNSGFKVPHFFLQSIVCQFILISIHLRLIWKIEKCPLSFSISQWKSVCCSMIKLFTSFGKNGACKLTQMALQKSANPIMINVDHWRFVNLGNRLRILVSLISHFFIHKSRFPIKWAAYQLFAAGAAFVFCPIYFFVVKSWILFHFIEFNIHESVKW